MPNLVLLGDSVFDNGRYTLGDPDVISQVRSLLPENWQASLLAVDGSITTDIHSQVTRIPADASHLILSVGGNNAIMNADILSFPADSSSQVLAKLADISSDFEKGYRLVVDACRNLKLPLAVCTIYNGRFPDPQYQRLISTALTVFNYAILRVAIEHHLAVIDLRLICSCAADYANPIEPSSVGGAKIAKAIIRWALDGSIGTSSASVLAS